MYVNLALSTLIPLQVRAVVVGYDRHLSYSKMIKTCSYAKNPRNIFLATNEDPYLPIEGKEIVIPGKTQK